MQAGLLWVRGEEVARALDRVWVGLLHFPRQLGAQIEAPMARVRRDSADEILATASRHAHQIAHRTSQACDAAAVCCASLFAQPDGIA